MLGLVMLSGFLRLHCVQLLLKAASFRNPKALFLTWSSGQTQRSPWTVAATLWEHALGISLKEVLWFFLLLPHCSNRGSKLSLDLTSREKDSMVNITFLLLSRHKARRWISTVHKIFLVSCLPSIWLDTTPLLPWSQGHLVAYYGQ